ncbi:LLM class F420-dependent oxidoreductase [Catenulispora rubra]|uniref:LLM class F420-dependent oxidoreductase n=1 Tax=Catenulispora rubra TaxID=280293 RepID=UPI0018926C2C|nr:LLM class F420-dependent oxidoreductase [Catenulispora rubra]
MVRPFRFGVNMITPAARDRWREKCRRAEALGFDVITVADHLGMPAPFPALVAAAEATERPRLGTFTLNAGFFNPMLLAREVATTDLLTDGRLELGLGTGYIRAEHDRANLPFGTPGERVAHLRATIEELDRLAVAEDFAPHPLQTPRPPLLIGGNGDRMLELAARHAEIVAFTGAAANPADPMGSPRALGAEELEARVAAYRKFAAERPEPAELNLLIQMIMPTDDRRAAIRPHLVHLPHLTEDQALELPILLIGSTQQMAEQLRAQRERFGISYLTVLEPWMEAFVPVMEALRGE